MEDPNDLHNYDRFTAALERRPKDLSPLMWLASLRDERPPEASEWMLRWLAEQRAPLTCAHCGYVEQPSIESHRCPSCGERY